MVAELCYDLAGQNNGKEPKLQTTSQLSLFQAMAQYRALVAFASAALFLIVAAQQTTPTVVRAYPTALRGATANRGTETSVHFNVVQSEAFTEKTNKGNPSRVILGHNHPFTNLSRESEFTAKNTSQYDDTARRLNEQTLTSLADVFHTLIKAAYFAQVTSLWLVAFVAAAGGLSLIHI